MASMTTVYTILSIAAINLSHLDVRTPYSMVDLQMEAYISLPQNYRNAEEVCEIKHFLGQINLLDLS